MNQEIVNRIIGSSCYHHKDIEQRAKQRLECAIDAIEDAISLREKHQYARDIGLISAVEILRALR